MLALLAIIAFIVGLVKVGSFDPWSAWLFLGLIALALDAAVVGWGSYPRLHR